ncbi:MAG TPA: sulfurtransferase TusA family protein [Gammaproteobacteria bacterium]|nr:sulfurtransferase TusA family protein [Gammaproteobacteria bacterium]
MNEIVDQSLPPLVDARGLNCPLPLLKLKKLLATRPGAAAYVLLATDPDSEADIRTLAARAGYALNVAREPDGALRFELMRPHGHS